MKTIVSADVPDAVVQCACPRCHNLLPTQRTCVCRAPVASVNLELGGTAGDLITCRPFDASLSLFQGGKLADLSSIQTVLTWITVIPLATLPIIACFPGVRNR